MTASHLDSKILMQWILKVRFLDLGQAASNSSPWACNGVHSRKMGAMAVVA